jgi:heme-degrading monooxygenase HmoA
MPPNEPSTMSSSTPGQHLVARIWTTKIDAERASDYERFAHEISLPMFRAQTGFAGALMLRNHDECQVITIWQSLEAAEALGSSPSYCQTVERIMAKGFIRGEQRIETLPVHLLFVDRNMRPS